jgi:hypothetical protein
MGPGKGHPFLGGTVDGQAIRICGNMSTAQRIEQLQLQQQICVITDATRKPQK